MAANEISPRPDHACTFLSGQFRPVTGYFGDIPYPFQGCLYDDTTLSKSYTTYPQRGTFNGDTFQVEMSIHSQIRTDRYNAQETLDRFVLY